ncbi:alpha-keto acid decarboxylase family protein [Methylacidimicrobium sp. B4]|uniref:alpha-keto acid decarboxylase family protein n=1 Tax=Methylacidimicrobium sp. B4 TaxID=2796139 RepID=UPI001A8F7C20|nr:thiamine pyrophosphate-binding protein [Methylacidimicrobium sp. B4]QSR83929.1 alpha-keto acid decarboxylase family protein [Methylacidimicrobium sp. B4]
MKETPSIADCLASRLQSEGIEYVFGVPGDYALALFSTFRKRGIETINTCDEQGAGFAADAYARIRGIGAACITYCVGGLKIANAVAEAYAEKSAVVVISGAPGMNERKKDPLLHHKVRSFDTQRKIFEEITVGTTVLDNPDTAASEIDRLLSLARRYHRPVYIEVPRDLLSAPTRPSSFPREPEESDPQALAEALEEARQMLLASRSPLILADVEIHRFGLQKELVELTERTGIPVAATLLGKSVIAETHPNYVGVYEGATGRAEVHDYVEASDCLLLLGVFLTDITVGGSTSSLDMSRCIYATSEKLSIRHHSFEGVRLADFVRGLRKLDIQKKVLPSAFAPSAGRIPKTAFRRQDRITVASLFAEINQILSPEIVVVADVGEALFGASELVIRESTEFLSPAYYASLGFAIPASLGAALANPRLRPLVLVGDGAFQMTGVELSTAVRFGLSPIVVLLNNRGYSTERHILDGPFNDLLEWNYCRLPELLGAGHACQVRTNQELEETLHAAWNQRDSYWLIEVRLSPHDHSPALERLAQRLSPDKRAGQAR